MTEKRIWLSSPHMGERELQYVQEAFSTNWVAPTGPAITAFEHSLSHFTGSRYTVVMGSGTAAIHIALVLLGVGIGDYVLCQSNTFVATANPVLYQKASPLFIDSEADTWNMDPEKLEEAIKHLYARGLGNRIKAIIPVHLYGMPANMQEINRIARHYEIPVVEDAAEALGSSYHGNACGNLGQFGVLSFNGNKIITTSGGGALLTNDYDAALKAQFLSTQARDSAPHYQHSEMGFNYRLSNVSASIGLGQMEVLEQRVEARRSVFNAYVEYFKKWRLQDKIEVDFQSEPSEAYSNRWLTGILMRPEKCNGLNVHDLTVALAEKDIESRPLWKPMHLQPLFRKAQFFGKDVSERLFADGLCLPSGSSLTEEDMNLIFNTMDNLIEKHRKKIYSAAHVA